jgi:hypothetical protein
LSVILFSDRLYFSSLTLLLLVRFIQGLGAAALSAVSITLVAKYFSTGRGKAFGIYNEIKGAGYVICSDARRIPRAWLRLVDDLCCLGRRRSCFPVTKPSLPSDRSQGRELKNDEELSLKEFFLILKIRASYQSTQSPSSTSSWSAFFSVFCPSIFTALATHSFNQAQC